MTVFTFTAQIEIEAPDETEARHNFDEFRQFVVPSDHGIVIWDLKLISTKPSTGDPPCDF